MESDVQRSSLTPGQRLLAFVAGAAVIYLLLTGLAQYLLPMGSSGNANAIQHSIVGFFVCVFLLVYLFIHWLTNRLKNTRATRISGKIGGLSIFIVFISGFPLLSNSLKSSTSPNAISSSVFDSIHLISSLVFLVTIVAHLVLQRMFWEGGEKKNHP